ncbi:MAG: 2-C-methyl-D-erythritol 4-phosphate cytidylyltransferase [Spirochaetaceae bacterium]|nr:2-C-methyl-D-erythritol 4-phosphate cytidylyltransferase [Myxococcales bacterium]MCB9726166.1 2-C-methyl-D-erythritol 4-phosphate cytidylyltransferase [Spirochaetaceae bacterium]
MAERARVAALILGAGRGERLGAALPKAFVEVVGRTLVERSIRALAAADVFGVLQPVLGAEDLGRFAALGIEDVEGLAAPVVGGRERQDSMRAGLAALPAAIEWVAVHDAARCLVSPRDVVRVVEVARATGAAILAEPVRDTIKRVESGAIVETPPREALWAAQTPQVLRRDWLEAGLAAATRDGRQATDDAQLVEWLGHVVRIVPASGPNPKITRPEDLRLAESLLASGTDEEPAHFGEGARRRAGVGEIGS